MLLDRFFRPATLALATASLLACSDRTDISGPVYDALDAQAAVHEVDISLLVPLLSPTFTNWKCVSTGHGPNCSGDRLLESDWEATDLPCSQTVYSRFRQYRTQTRYYDEDNLNFFRRFHQDAPEYFSLSSTGDGPVVVVDAHSNWTETYVVAGDDQTRTIEGVGMFFKLKDTHGGVIRQWSGHILEVPGEDLFIQGGNIHSWKSLTDDEDVVPALCSALGTELLP
jgi:hypothetical protein